MGFLGQKPTRTHPKVGLIFHPDNSLQPLLLGSSCRKRFFQSWHVILPLMYQKCKTFFVSSKILLQNVIKNWKKYVKKIFLILPQKIKNCFRQFPCMKMSENSIKPKAWKIWLDKRKFVLSIKINFPPDAWRKNLWRFKLPPPPFPLAHRKRTRGYLHEFVLPFLPYTDILNERRPLRCSKRWL